MNYLVSDYLAKTTKTTTFAFIFWQMEIKLGSVLELVPGWHTAKVSLLKGTLAVLGTLHFHYVGSLPHSCDPLIGFLLLLNPPHSSPLCFSYINHKVKYFALCESSLCVSLCVYVWQYVLGQMCLPPLVAGWLCVCVGVYTCISLGHDSSLLAFGLLPPYIINPKHL